MTIGAGFRCTDGLVICVDQEYTEGGLLKFTGSKMQVYEGLSCKCVLTFSGDRDFATMGMDNMIEKIHRSNETSAEIRAIIAGEIQQLHKKHIYRHPGYRDGIGPEVSYLVGVWTEQQQTDLWSTSRTTLTPVETWQPIGVGHYLAAYIGGTLFDDFLSVREAALLGSYLLSEAKEHVPGCGGKSMIVTITKDGKIKKDDSLTVFEGEAWFSEFSDLVKKLFYALGNLDMPAAQAKLIVGESIEKALTLRERRIKYRELHERDIELMKRIGKDQSEL